VTSCLQIGGLIAPKNSSGFSLLSLVAPHNLHQYLVHKYTMGPCVQNMNFIHKYAMGPCVQKVYPIHNYTTGPSVQNIYPIQKYATGPCIQNIYAMHKTPWAHTLFTCIQFIIMGPLICNTEFIYNRNMGPSLVYDVLYAGPILDKGDLYNHDSDRPIPFLRVFVKKGFPFRTGKND
jgi:hypothetical protein